MPLFKPLRLSDYDYSQAGCYFITMCVKDRHWILWEAPVVVAANCVRPEELASHYLLSDIGTIVENEIAVLSKTYENIYVDKYVVMPNHLHMIIVIRHNDRPSQIAPTVSRAMKQFKGSVTKQLGYSIWQKSFHDHIIRDKHDYFEKWNYIDGNPMRWLEDEYHTVP